MTPPPVTDTPDDVLSFWIQAGPKQWFAHDEAFDAEIGRSFLALHLTASRGALMDWAKDARGALALLVLLDQFPRNMWRGSAHAYATDPLARAVAERAVGQGFDQQ